MPISIEKDIVDERHHRDTVKQKKKRESLDKENPNRMQARAVFVLSACISILDERKIKRGQLAGE